MAKDISDINSLQKYLIGVMGRGNHHAEDVSEIVLTLVGAVIWKKNDDPIQVRQHRGELANILWWHSKKQKKYAFRYDHVERKIELRKKTYKGDVIATFDNKSQTSDIIEIFDAL